MWKNTGSDQERFLPELFVSVFVMLLPPLLEDKVFIRLLCGAAVQKQKHTPAGTLTCKTEAGHPLMCCIYRPFSAAFRAL